MLILHATTDIIRVVTGSAADVEVVVSVMEADNSTPPVIQDFPNVGPLASIVTATTTTIADCTTANRRRNVKHLSLYNNHATVSTTCRVEFSDGTNVAVLANVTLLAGEMLVFNQGGTWIHYDAGGNPILGGSGRFLQTSVLTSGTSFTTRTDTRTIKLRGVAGGGGGGGCTSVAAAAAAAGGGVSGGYFEKTFAVNGNTAYTYAIGAAGTNASAAAGGIGGNTTFTVGGVTVTAFGGPGGLLATATTTVPSTFDTGAAGAISTNGDVNIGGAPGQIGATWSLTIKAAGAGGNSEMGAGGKGIRADGAGSAAVGFGGGGGGSATGASAARAGGAPSAGVIMVDEYS